MAGKFDQRGKEAPTEEDMPHVWRALSRADRMWPIVAPLVAVAEYKKSWLFILGVIAFFQGPDLINVVASYLGVTP